MNLSREKWSEIHGRDKCERVKFTHPKFDIIYIKKSNVHKYFYIKSDKFR